jgi:two-component system CheB/CheR fusion protein
MKGRGNMVEKITKSKEEIKKSREEQLHTAEEIPVIEPPAPDADSNKSSTAEFPIVGIGASAGGLAAFENFFSAISDNTNPGMAFVVIQHLDPSHKSMLTDLIGRYTRMPVYEVEDGMVVQPNCVYVIPPNRDMIFEYGTLQIQEPAEPRGPRLPINLFFRSLALSKLELSIGIILSGTGEDGTLGARAIKDAGGMVMVQSPESSEYDGMPKSAIATSSRLHPTAS